MRDGVCARDLLGRAEDDFAQAERATIRRALMRNNGNVSAAAKSLDISRATIKRKLNRYGLKRKP
jgi:transcriptional regulator of acetoin/glycerol metabolism